MNGTTEQVHFVTGESVENVSQAFQLSTQPSTSRFASLMFGLVSSVTGMYANALVVVVLVFARRHFGSSVNTLITNQSLMDLLSCIFLTIGLAMSFPGTPPNYPWLGEIGNKVVCFLFPSQALAYFCMHSERFGLVAIALERYFKIVHAIAHRKHYRDWMTSVGVAVPWIMGFLI